VNFKYNNKNFLNFFNSTYYIFLLLIFFFLGFIFRPRIIEAEQSPPTPSPSSTSTRTQVVVTVAGGFFRNL